MSCLKSVKIQKLMGLSLGLLFLGSAALSASVSADSSVPEEVQTILNVKIDLGESPLWNDTHQIKADVPVKILSNSGEIVAIQIGEDETTRFHYFQKDGTRFDVLMNSTVIPMALLKNHAYSVDANFMHLINRELLAIDASQLDAQQGGELKIKYVSGVISDNYVNFRLYRSGNGWAASATNSFDKAPETSTHVTALHISGSGLGFQPAEIESSSDAASPASAPIPLSDPKVAQDKMKQGEESISDFEQNPIDVGSTRLILQSSGAE